MHNAAICVCRLHAIHERARCVPWKSAFALPQPLDKNKRCGLPHQAGCNGSERESRSCILGHLAGPNGASRRGWGASASTRAGIPSVFLKHFLCRSQTVPNWWRGGGSQRYRCTWLAAPFLFIRRPWHCNAECCTLLWWIGQLELKRQNTHLLHLNTSMPISACLFSFTLTPTVIDTLVFSQSLVARLPSLLNF